MSKVDSVKPLNIEKENGSKLELKKHKVSEKLSFVQPHQENTSSMRQSNRVVSAP